MDGMSSAGICQGRVVVVTGAGRGLGRRYAEALAAEGARLLVNDIDLDTARETAAAIAAAGGEAEANSDDITSREAAGGIVRQALECFGGLHAVVNNAGICRDRMFVSLSEREWDDVVRVHLKGHYCLSSQACAYWRAESKAGREPQGRIVNTSSGAGLQGSVGQSNYAAAKAGIAALTLVQAAELGRYGITANALAPSARTAMTTQVAVFAERMKAPEDGSFDYYHPGNIAPLVVWLASSLSGHVSGQVFEVEGGKIILGDGWRRGPEVDKGMRWQPSEVGPAVDGLLRDAMPPLPVYGAS